MVKVTATDLDEKNDFGDGYGDIAYFLKPDSQFFTIDRDSGIIEVRADLDREKDVINEYQLTVIAQDGGGKLNEPMNQAVAEVIVKIGDINDNPPRFVDCPSQISFAEDAVVGLDGDTRSIRVVDSDIEENGQV